MNNAGLFTLGALTIPSAGSSLLSFQGDFGGMSAVTLDADFKYGSGGTTIQAIVVTSFDGGTTLLHVARFDFTTANLHKFANVSGLSPKGVAAYADLNADSVNDGLLGNTLALKLIVTGTYSGSVLAVRAAVR